MSLKQTQYLEGQGDLVSGLIKGINRVTMWVIGLLTYLLSPPDPPSIDSRLDFFHVILQYSGVT